MDASDTPGRRLATVIVSYRSASVLGECLAALRSAMQVGRQRGTLGPTRTLVVDNAGDLSAAQLTADAELLWMGHNAGFPRAVNHALASLPPDVDLVLLLNPDARLAEDALDRLVRTAVETGAAIVGPMLTNERGRPQRSSVRGPHNLFREAVRQLVGVRVLAAVEWRRRPRRPVLTGACLLVERAFLVAIGGLDTRLPMYLEDVELCRRAHRAGRPVVFEPRATCVHALGGSSGGTNFASNQELALLLLEARRRFVADRSRVRSALFRALVLLGTALRWLTRPTARHTRRAALIARWALGRRSPRWPPEQDGEPGWPTP